jgi:transcriptional regulator with XRE-family HTH domain
MYQHIKDLREDCDLTQKYIAGLLNVSQTTYSRYESGTLDIPSSSLIALGKFYETSVDYLLGLTNNKTPYNTLTLP